MGLGLYLAGRSLGFYLGSLFRASSWNILIVCSGFGFWFWACFFFCQMVKKESRCQGLTPRASQHPWQHLPGQGGQTGLTEALCLPGGIFWGGAGGLHRLPCPPARPGPHVHPQPLPKGSDQHVRAQDGDIHTHITTRRVSPSSGCYGDLKIARAIRRGESIPFFQESEKCCSRPGNVPAFGGRGGVLFVRKALRCPPGTWM